MTYLSSRRSPDAAIKDFLPNVKHVHCIFHIRQNLDRHVQRSLGENYNEFLSKFYSVRNSLNETVFNIKWNQLNELYPCVSDYLMGTLDKIKKSWGKAFVCTVNILHLLLSLKLKNL